MTRARRAAVPLVCMLGAATPLAAQGPVRDTLPPATPRLVVTLNVGLARRQTDPWQDIHLALEPAGWDAYFQQAVRCAPYCPGASDVVRGRPATLALSARFRARGRFQWRAFAATGPMGRYPGARNAVELTITPSVHSVGAQAAWSVKSLWIAAGPSLNLGRVVERAGAERRTATEMRAGLALGAGLMFPQRGPRFIELSVEHRLSGTMTLAPMNVPAAGAPVPAMPVPLTHTILSVGLGLRR